MIIKTEGFCFRCFIIHSVQTTTVLFPTRHERKKKKKKKNTPMLNSTCSLSSDSWPDSWDTRVTVLSSFSCRERISFCSLSPSLLTRDMALIRGNHSKFFSWEVEERERERERKREWGMRRVEGTQGPNSADSAGQRESCDGRDKGEEDLHRHRGSVSAGGEYTEGVLVTGERRGGLILIIPSAWKLLSLCFFFCFFCARQCKKKKLKQRHRL